MESNNLMAKCNSRTLYPLVRWQEAMGESARKAAADGRTVRTWTEGVVNPVFWKSCPLTLGLPASRSLWRVNPLFSSVLLGPRDGQDFPHQPQRGHSTWCWDRDCTQTLCCRRSGACVQWSGGNMLFSFPSQELIMFFEQLLKTDTSYHQTRSA